ncbi:MAG TPA: type II toxin-antitoxin system Phd/YefM family antitoxin [Xanthomonadaceae bacterium]|nr:type II toxin-antitoxin system Phd/YefM family antitoxin [Xanthomonadaceae bacterium]
MATPFWAGSAPPTRSPTWPRPRHFTANGGRHRSHRGQRQQFISRRDAEGDAVVMSLDYYNSIMETPHLLATPANAEATALGRRARLPGLIA